MRYEMLTRDRRSSLKPLSTTKVGQRTQPIRPNETDSGEMTNLKAAIAPGFTVPPTLLARGEQRSNRRCSVAVHVSLADPVRICTPLDNAALRGAHPLQTALSAPR